LACAVAAGGAESEVPGTTRRAQPGLSRGGPLHPGRLRAEARLLRAGRRPLRGHRPAPEAAVHPARAVTSLDLDTPHGPARAVLGLQEDARGAFVVGHGGGGGVTARALVAGADAAESLAISVALVEQPYRVAGRRSPAPAAQLDSAWIAVLEALERRQLAGLPLVVG